MADVNIEDCVDRIRVEVPQCPSELMESELIKVVREFCQITRAWQYEGQATITLGQSDYTIPVTDAAKAQPIAVEFLTVDGVPVEFKEVEWLDRMISNWRLRAADDFRYFTQIQPKTIVFPCVPTQNGTTNGLKYRVSLKPPLTAAVLDSDFLNEWQDTLEDGTKGNLLLMEGKPWFRGKRGEFLLRSHIRARSQARIRVARSYGNPEQRVYGAKFA